MTGRKKGSIVVCLIGADGIGKTTLKNELTSLMKRGHRSVLGFSFADVLRKDLAGLVRQHGLILAEGAMKTKEAKERNPGLRDALIGLGSLYRTLGVVNSTLVDFLNDVQHRWSGHAAPRIIIDDLRFASEIDCLRDHAQTKTVLVIELKREGERVSNGYELKQVRGKADVYKTLVLSAPEKDAVAVLKMIHTIEVSG